MELIFATHNAHKLQEAQQMLPDFSLKSLNEIGFTDEIVEDGNTFEENAYIKSKTIYDKTHLNVFSDDSGLVIPALNGAPGIFSARYAGTENSKDNVVKVLNEMENITDRQAYFIAVISLIWNGKNYFFEGKVHGQILTEIQGDNGFGYDPIFRPNGHGTSFAQMPEAEKNKISHRALAIEKMNDNFTT